MSPYCPPKGIELSEQGCADIARAGKFKACASCETYRGETACARCGGMEKNVGGLNASLLCSKCEERVEEIVKEDTCQLCKKGPVQFKRHLDRPPCCERCYHEWKGKQRKAQGDAEKRPQRAVTEAGTAPAEVSRPSPLPQTATLAPDRAGVGATILLNQAAEGFLIVARDSAIPLEKKGNILESLAATAENLSRAVRVRAERGM